MKKLAGRFLCTALAAILAFGGVLLNINFKAARKTKTLAYSAPAPFTDHLMRSSGDGSSLVIYNPKELGTTTLFSGSSIAANGTIKGQNINFNIYGNDSGSDTKIVSTRQEYYLVSNGNQYIETGIAPDSETTLEVFFMLPNNYSISGTEIHQDVVGSRIKFPVPDIYEMEHFGGPLLNNANNTIQYLYGTYPANSKILEARDTSADPEGEFKWAAGNQYHSILEASGGKARVHLTDGNKTYEDEFAYDIEPYIFNNLLLFGQQNETPWNKFSGGIKEVKITQRGEVKRHFFAVPEGADDFLSVSATQTVAPSNCMFDIVTKRYFVNNGAGSFGIEMDDTNPVEIDIMNNVIGGVLRGEQVASGDFTYEDGNGAKWAADYIEVNQNDSTVILHRYTKNGNTVTYISQDLTGIDSALAEKLLSIKTNSGMTILSNDSGAWMDGIIGPIVNYEIRLGTGFAGVTFEDGGTVKTINILDLGASGKENITANKWPSGAYSGAFWRISAAHGLPAKNLYLSIVDNSSTQIATKDILLDPDKILQQYAQKDGNAYYIEVDIDFADLYMVEVRVSPNLTKGLDGVAINGRQQSSANIIADSLYVIEGIFDQVLYEFDELIIDGSRYTGPSIIGRPNTFEITAPLTPGTVVNIEYKIKPKKYSVQILGKTTRNEEVHFLGPDIINGYENNEVDNKIWFDAENLMEISYSGLSRVVDIDHEYISEAMIFGENRLYVFDHFQINGKVINGDLSIDSFALLDNPRVDGKFTIYAVFQKKYIVNLGFKFNDAAEPGSSYSLTSTSAKAFDKIAGRNGYSINEGDTAVILLTPDKRYSVSTVSGDDGTSQISKDMPNLLVVKMDKSYNIVVTLEHRTIKIDYNLNIIDNNSREIFGTPEYIIGGNKPNANHTLISFEDAEPHILVANQDMLNKFNYRNKALMIYNFMTSEYDLITDMFPDGKIVANDDFFKLYVDEDGNSRVCLFVIQQFFVDLSTPRFVQDDTTFTNSDLGSYSIEFVGGEYTSLGDGKYMVDIGTEIKLEKTVGKHGKFLHYTGLNETENDAGRFIVTGDRYVGVNFESTKLKPWIIPSILSGTGVAILAILVAIYFATRSMKLKAQRIAAEKEINDMKRKLNIANEIEALRRGDDVPQMKKVQPSKK